MVGSLQDGTKDSEWWHVALRLGLIGFYLPPCYFGPHILQMTVTSYQEKRLSGFHEEGGKSTLNPGQYHVILHLSININYFTC